MRLVEYDVIIETLTPLHIGTGEEWQLDADFVVEQRQGQRVARLIDAGAALLDMTPNEIASIREGRIAAAIGEAGRKRHTIAVLPVRGPGNVTRTRALQRLPDGRPFIPGTTVKGSIRTALLQALVQPHQVAELPAPGSRDPRKAAARAEEDVLGTALNAPGDRGVQFANRDLNRLIRVSDFLPAGDVRVAFVNMSAHRLGEAPPRQRSAPIPIWCEAIEPGATFKGVLTVEVDSPLWNAMSGAQREKVERPFRTWSEAGRRLLEIELKAWERGPATVRESVVRFFQDALDRNEIVVNLGWGGGWRSKTLADRIPVGRLRTIADRYDLTRWKGRDFPDRFPVTRKLASTAAGPKPPGWVRVLWKRRQG